ncbi:MAG: Hsp33 family molecular chaperone HslO [Geopsychrobacter sp.]|nr:Hsp33 family molecular chaperone HslO [Geopsychrobacter sp.]
MSDQLVRVVTQDGQLRAAAADTTQLVAEICRRQQADLTARVALGRLLTGAALMGCLLKEDQRLALMVEGNGPLGRLMVETDARGSIRGKLQNPVAGLPPREDRFDVAGAIGRAGFLHVIKDLGLKEPYRSMVQLQTSEIGEDLAWYLTHSGQVPSCVAVGVEFDGQGEIAAAGGFLVQALPPGDQEQLAVLEQNLEGLTPTTSLLRQGNSLETILGKVLGGQSFSVQQQNPLIYSCLCSRRQISAMLQGLGEQELKAMIREQGGAEVCCDYCREAYLFSAEELEVLRS